MTRKIATREAYGEALVELGRENPAVVVLDADLSKSTKTSLFARAFPDRFFNVGIAEQNLMGTAAGLAAAGKIPFASTFAIFATGRAFEQVRNSIAYAGLNVKIGASHAGITVGEDGASHQSVEDLALMRAIPGMTVIVPADAEETRKAVRAAAGWEGPVYLRLGRYPTPRLFGSDYAFALGQPVRLREGGDVVLLACGHMVAKALEAAELLARDHLEARVVNVSTIKPLRRQAILAEVTGVERAFTVEEFSILGGLGSAVAEVLAEDAQVPLTRLGTRDEFGESGLADELLEKHGLQPGGIHASVLDALRRGLAP